MCLTYWRWKQWYSLMLEAHSVLWNVSFIICVCNTKSITFSVGNIFHILCIVVQEYCSCGDFWLPLDAQCQLLCTILLNIFRFRRLNKDLCLVYFMVHSWTVFWVSRSDAISAFQDQEKTSLLLQQDPWEERYPCLRLLYAFTFSSPSLPLIVMQWTVWHLGVRRVYYHSFIGISHDSLPVDKVLTLFSLSTDLQSTKLRNAFPNSIAVEI